MPSYKRHMIGRSLKPLSGARTPCTHPLKTLSLMTSAASAEVLRVGGPSPKANQQASAARAQRGQV
eukprot:11477066-Karenia_brevis.AAC.1